MDHIQTDTSDEALVTAIRANLCEFYQYLGTAFPEGHFESEKFSRWRAPIQHPWFNGVLSSRPPEKVDEAFIEETIQYFRANHVGTFTWWMQPHLRPSDWEPVLSRFKFGFSNDTPGMAVDLQSLNESTPSTDEIEVRVVADEETLRTWAHIFTTGYGLPPEWEPNIYDLELRMGLGYPVRNYIGYWKDEPVSTSCVFFGGGAAGIYSVATLPHMRGKGIGAATTLRPLLNARKMGYRIGVLQSSSMGFNVYKQLGFRHLCQIENFYRKLT